MPVDPYRKRKIISQILDAPEKNYHSVNKPDQSDIKTIKVRFSKKAIVPNQVDSGIRLSY
jgi:hypothetical protein